MHIVLPVWAESAWAVAPWPMQLHARMSQLAAQCLSGAGFVLLVLQSSHLAIPVTYMARDTERDTHRAGPPGPPGRGRAAPSAATSNNARKYGSSPRASSLNKGAMYANPL